MNIYIIINITMFIVGFLIGWVVLLINENRKLRIEADKRIKK